MSNSNIESEVQKFLKDLMHIRNRVYQTRKVDTDKFFYEELFLTLSLFRRYSKNRPSVLLWGMLLG